MFLLSRNCFYSEHNFEMQEFCATISDCDSPFPRVFSLLPFPLKREPTATAWRGTTLSTHIYWYRALIMPLRFVRRLRNNMAQSLVQIVKFGVRYGRRRCGSDFVFEYTHSVTMRCSDDAIRSIAHSNFNCDICASGKEEYRTRKFQCTSAYTN